MSTGPVLARRLGYRGVTRTARLARVAVAVVLAALTVAVTATLLGGAPS